MNSSEAGLVLSSAVSLAGIFHWALRQWVEVANSMTVIERILEYCKLPSEAPLESSEGSLSFLSHSRSTQSLSNSERYER